MMRTPERQLTSTLTATWALADCQSAAPSKAGLLVPARGRRVANPPQATSLPHKKGRTRLSFPPSVRPANGFSNYLPTLLFGSQPAIHRDLRWGPDTAV